MPFNMSPSTTRRSSINNNYDFYSYSFQWISVFPPKVLRYKNPEAQPADLTIRVDCQLQPLYWQHANRILEMMRLTNPAGMESHNSQRIRM